MAWWHEKNDSRYREGLVMRQRAYVHAFENNIAGILERPGKKLVMRPIPHVTLPVEFTKLGVPL